jgi:integrase
MRAQRTKPLPAGMTDRGGGRILAQVYDKRTGKRKGKTFSKRELAAAKAWRRDTQIAIEKGALRVGECPTLRTAATMFLAGVEDGTIRSRKRERYRASTIRRYRLGLRMYLLPALGSLRLSEIRPGQLASLVGELQAQGLAASSVRNTITPLQAIYRWAIRRELVIVDPTTSLELPLDRGRRERFATVEEIGLLLATLKVEDRPLWATAIYAGLRRGELMALRWEDVDLLDGVIRVEHSWNPETSSETEPKSVAGSRRVPIPPVLHEHLSAQRERTGGDELVFGHFCHSAVARRALRRWRDQGLTPINMHECRHTYASLMIAAGVNAKALSTYLGHATISITLDRYGHLMPGNEVEAAGRLQDYLDRELQLTA